MISLTRRRSAGTQPLNDSSVVPPCAAKSKNRTTTPPFWATVPRWMCANRILTPSSTIPSVVMSKQTVPCPGELVLAVQVGRERPASGGRRGHDGERQDESCDRREGDRRHLACATHGRSSAAAVMAPGTGRRRGARRSTRTALAC
jgi:hypothetical protein